MAGEEIPDESVLFILGISDLEIPFFYLRCNGIGTIRKMVGVDQAEDPGSCLQCQVMDLPTVGQTFFIVAIGVDKLDALNDDLFPEPAFCCRFQVLPGQELVHDIFYDRLEVSVMFLY